MYVLLSNAVSRANRERLECLLGVVGEPRVAQPSLRDELVGLCKVGRVVIDGPLPDVHGGLGRILVSAHGAHTI